LFDLDADPYAVDVRLGADPRLAPLVAARPGLRSPGTADPDELAVRALVGRDRAALLVQRYGKALDAPCGTLTHLFPEPSVLAGAEPGGTLGALTAALADGTLRLDPGADRDAATAALRALPGLDDHTVAVIRTRALGDPDVAPPGTGAPDDWRPWRSYRPGAWQCAPPPSRRRAGPAAAARTGRCRRGNPGRRRARAPARSRGRNRRRRRRSCGRRCRAPAAAAGAAPSAPPGTGTAGRSRPRAPTTRPAGGPSAPTRRPRPTRATIRAPRAPALRTDRTGSPARSAGGPMLPSVQGAGGRGRAQSGGARTGA